MDKYQLGSTEYYIYRVRYWAKNNFQQVSVDLNYRMFEYISILIQVLVYPLHLEIYLIKRK